MTTKYKTQGNPTPAAPGTGTPPPVVCGTSVLQLQYLKIQRQKALLEKAKEVLLGNAVVSSYALVEAIDEEAGKA